MSRLVLLASHGQVQQIRQSVAGQSGEVVPSTLAGLISHILKEQGVAYRENPLLEQLACWEAVWDLQDKLTAFAELTEFPGFVRDLLLLFAQIGHEEPILDRLNPQDKQELTALYQGYQTNLAKKKALDTAGQLRKALQLLPKCSWLEEVNELELTYLGRLSPLEEKLVAQLSKGRRVINTLAKPGGKQQIWAARDRYHEISCVADHIRQQLQAGVSPDEIGVALVDPVTYGPIINSVFKQFGIPHKEQGRSIAQTPLGRTVLTLLQGIMGNWPKENLLLLTAPGWGLPSGLDAEMRQVLKAAPPHKGLAVWSEELGAWPAWEQFLTELEEYEQLFTTQTLRDHSGVLEELVDKLSTNMSWDDEYQMGYELQAAEGLKQICTALSEGDHLVTVEQFTQLVTASCGDYQLKPARSFWSEVKVNSLQQLVGEKLACVYLVGLVDGSFPRIRNTHWLTRQAVHYDEEQLFKEVLATSNHAYLLYPENDEDGRMTLPSPLLPAGSVRKLPKARVETVQVPPVSLGNGRLTHPRLLETLRANLLIKGLTVSELNNYAQCPYGFYCQKVLEITPVEERTGELTAADEGTLVHQVLQGFWQAHLTGPLPSASQAEEEIVAISHGVYQANHQLLPARMERTFIRFILQDLARLPGGYRPYLLEEHFSALKIPTAFGKLRVRGVIDRIDRHEETGNYILYDYKTGANPSLKEVALGGHLQLPIYLLAAKELMSGEAVGAAFYSFREGRPSGLWRLEEIKNLGVRKTNYCWNGPEWERVIQDFRDKLVTQAEGILTGRFPVEPFSDQVCSYCPFPDICRREVS